MKKKTNLSNARIDIKHQLACARKRLITKVCRSTKSFEAQYLPPACLPACLRANVKIRHLYCAWIWKLYMDKVKSPNWKQKWFCAFEQNHLFPIKPRLFPKSINIITPHTLWSWYCFVFKALCRVISTAFKILIRRGFPSKTKIHAKRYQRSVIHSLSSITAQPD